jgi:hypothetical protein
MKVPENYIAAIVTLAVFGTGQDKPGSIVTELLSCQCVRRMLFAAIRADGSRFGCVVSVHFGFTEMVCFTAQ